MLIFCQNMSITLSRPSYKQLKFKYDVYLLNYEIKIET